MKKLLPFLLVLVSTPAFSVNYYVDSAATGIRDGSSWVNAFDSLHPALAVAGGGDTVFVAQGTYRPPAGNDRTKCFVIPSGTVLLGGYPTGGGARNVDEYPAILSGDTGTAADSSDNTYHVVFFNMTNPATELNGFYITGGYADGEGDNGNGGGIYVLTHSSGSYGAKIINCRVYGNFAKGGGGISVNKKADIYNTIIENNRALTTGGGLAISVDGRAYNTVIRNNYSGGSGGGVTIGGFNTASKLINCLISNNEAATNGGGVSQGESMLINCTVVNNKGGGGIYQSSIYASVRNSVIWGNEPVQLWNYKADRYFYCAIADATIDFDGSTNFAVDTLNDGMTDTSSYVHFAAPADSVGNVFTPEGLQNIRDADWYLNPGSACINRGDKSLYPDYAPDHDLYGNPRIVVDTIDVGSSEAVIDLRTGSATVSEQEVTLYGNVLFSLDLDLTRRGFDWGDAPDHLTNHIENSTTGWYAYSGVISPLPDPGVYYYRTWGMVGSRAYPGPVKSFTVCSQDTTREEADACAGTPFVFPDSTVVDSITESTVYYSHLTSVTGCDSIVETTVTVITVDTSVTAEGIILTAGATGASYQWVDCDNNYAAIDGATEQSFTAEQNGNYAVIVTAGVCSDTSSCHAVTTVGIGEQNIRSSFEVYPNPAGEMLKVENSENVFSGKISLMDITGKTVLKTEVEQVRVVEIPLAGIRPGVYFLKIRSERKIVVIRILKK